LHQATCVAIGGRAILIEGPPGSGKSSLALALIDRGATLIGDDGVELEARAGWLWALPPPRIAGLLEIRNVGVVSYPTMKAPLALAVRLDPDAPRFIEVPDTVEFLACAVPLVRLWPDTPVLALRVEHALNRFGLS
jgi:serine kinase of HPr protein (carbohydrate metabolism regulator)